MRYFLGLEGGARKTVCYLADERGRILGRGEAGSSIYYAGGVEKAVQQMARAWDQAMLSHPDSIGKIDTVCIGLAGMDSPTGYNRMHRVLTRKKLAENIVLENDALTALIGGNAQIYGAILLVGIGSIAFGINKAGQRKRAGGWGHTVGDEGSGYDIGIAAIKAAFKAYDGRDEKTVLEEMIIEKLGLNSMEDIMDKIHFSLKRNDIASFVSLVFAAVEQGDRVAQRILIRAGDELGQSLAAVVTGLGMSGEEIDIPLAGEVFEGGKEQFLIDVIKERVLSVAPRAQVVEPQFEPAIGAVIYALAQSGTGIEAGIIANLRGTYGEFADN